MCPLVDVLREEVRGDPGGNPKRLAGGELHGRRTQGGGGHGAALGEPLHAFCPARGDCADLGAFDADRDPWAGDLEGLGGEGTVATARAWISPEGVLRPVDVNGPSQGGGFPEGRIWGTSGPLGGFEAGKVIR